MVRHKVSGAKTKRQAVDRALREMAGRRAADGALRKLRGKLPWEGDVEAWRRGGAPTMERAGRLTRRGRHE